MISIKKHRIILYATCIFIINTQFAFAQPNEDMIELFTSAKGFFKNLQNKNYVSVWDSITEKSKKTIIENIFKQQKETGEKATIGEITTDFANCAKLCKTFWTAYVWSFDPDLALRESQWALGFIKKDKAELLITHKRSEAPAKLKMFRESGQWKVGFTETFWNFWTRK